MSRQTPPARSTGRCRSPPRSTAPTSTPRPCRETQGPPKNRTNPLVEPTDHALGRSRGGLSTKDTVTVTVAVGRWPYWSDRAGPVMPRYSRGIEAVIPGPRDQQTHRNRRGRGGGRPVTYDTDAQARNVVERSFNALKNWRGVATCYDTLASPAAEGPSWPPPSRGYAGEERLWTLTLRPKLVTQYLYVIDALAATSALPLRTTSHRQVVTLRDGCNPYRSSPCR